MKIHSVRWRLTLWNVGVVALILFFFAGTLHFLVRWSLTASIDTGLDQRLAWEKSLFRPEWLARRGRGNGPSPTEESRNERRNAPLPSQSEAASLEGRQNRLRASLIEIGIFDVRGRPAHPLSTPRPWDREAFSRSLKGETVRVTRSLEGIPVRLLSSPLIYGGKVVRVYQFGQPLDETERMMANLDRILLLLMLPALVVVGLSGAFLTNHSLRPVRKFSHAASELAASDFSHRLSEEGDDEFSELAVNFNTMTDRLEEAFGKLRLANEEMETANEKLRAAYDRQRRFIADASHELRTPLAAIKANTSLALFEDFSPGEYRESMEVIDHAAGAMGRIVEDLLLLARSDNDELRMEVKSILLKEVVVTAVSEANRKRRGNPVRADLPEPDLRVVGDPHHLRRLLMNLLDNALRHTPEEGTVTVMAEQKGEEIVLQVEDTGSGIAHEHLPHVFDRFYRADDARSRDDGGAGLGLAICRSIVEAHSGTIEIDSRPGEGTTVTVRLPMGAASEAEQSPELETIRQKSP